MRGGMSVVITFIIVFAVAGLYILLGKSQISRTIREQNAKLAEQEAKAELISQHEAEMAKLTQQLPVWREQLTMFKKAIPPQIDDQLFLASINEQLKQNNVKIDTIQVVPAGSWLKDADEKTLKALEGMGLDVTQMRKVQVAYYAVRLSGEFGKILTSFENLKQYGRLYTIDLITSQPGGGGGAVAEISDDKEHPIMLTGALFYGIEENYLDVESLNQVFATRYAKPLARSVFQQVFTKAQQLRRADQPGQQAPNKPGTPPAAGAAPAAQGS